MRIPILFALGALTMFRSYGQTTIVDDAANLLAQNKCDAAIIKLEAAPAEIQNTPYYLKTLARAHDCTNHTAEAITYYRRYLKKGSDDSVKARYDALVKKRESDDLSNSANDQYRKLTGIKHKYKKRKGYYLGYALEGMIPTAGGPFGWGLRYCAEMGIPLKTKKAELILDLSFTGYSEMRRKWMETVLKNVPYDNFGMRPSLGTDLTAFVPYWLVKGDEIKFGAGPVFGFRFTDLADPTYYTNDKIKLPNLFGLTYGVEAILSRELQSVSLGYSFFNIKKSALVIGGNPFTANINCITIKISGKLLKW